MRNLQRAAKGNYRIGNSTTNMENICMLKQEIEQLRKALYLSLADKSELQKKVSIYEHSVEERDKMFASQIADIIYSVESHIEQIVMETRCFYFRRNKTKQKVRILFKIRSQLKQIQFSIFPSVMENRKWSKDFDSLQAVKAYFV